jgi:HlyD family secretion protein
VERGTLEQKVSAMGNLAIPQQAKLTFGVGGTVDTVQVEVGDKVNKGQVLAQLETAALKRAVTQAQASLSTAQINLDNVANPSEADIAAAQGAVRNAQVALENAKRDLDYTKLNADLDIQRAEASLQNYRTIYSDRLARFQGTFSSYYRPTQADVEQAALSVSQAEKALELAQQAKPKLITNAENAVAQAEDNLKRAIETRDQVVAGPASDAARLAANLVTAAQVALEAAQESLDKATLTAPFDGVVASVVAKAKESVLSSTVMVYLVNPGVVELEADVDEVDILQVKLGQQVRVFFDALPDVEFSGKVKAMSPVGTKESGVVSYPVTITVEPKAGVDLKEGLTGTSEFIVGRKENVLSVPNRFIKTGSPSTVVVVTSTGAEVRQVELGMNDGQRTEIIKGLGAGERVTVATPGSP